MDEHHGRVQLSAWLSEDGSAIGFTTALTGDIDETQNAYYKEDTIPAIDFTSVCDIYYVSRDGNCEGKNPCYSTIPVAVTAAGTGTFIRVEEGIYPESISLDAPITVTLQGGWDRLFKNQTANKTFIKAPAVHSGTLIMQMLTIKP